MKYLKTLSIVAVFTLLAFGYAFSGETESKTMSPQICPVMTFGELGCSVTKNDIYTDYNDKRIYFCSKGCLERVSERPCKIYRETGK